MFKGLSAIVTGGGSGLGLATAKKLLGSGCSVLVCDIQKSPGFNEIENDCVYCPTDVASETDATNAVQMAKSKFSKLDILVNCAGTAFACKTYNATKKQPHPLETFEKAIRVNTIGTFNMIRMAVLLMAENKPDQDNLRGVIINTASVAAFEGQVGQVAYAASKGAVASMTLPIARDLAREGIRVMAIAPGFFDTPLLSGLPSHEHLIRHVVSPKRLGKPHEFAMLVEAIIQNPMLNGEVIRIDAGTRMPP
ncbi:Hydroxysteroid 17-beta dehydrogenase 10 [Fasciola hepatica]|uniref:3-hydroxyacyl-CoA dehydrogenase type-2 n=1 Tax=Fasciola hepatica TaxID=6192 RepID=A0A4E0RJ23_FASHE|nr:Hydroxysteroid 17-beta dehydrogenase 10 [Fasciola hepatica]